MRRSRLLLHHPGGCLPTPRTRAECIAGHPSTGSVTDRWNGIRCGAWLCRHNLDRIDGTDRPGRRNGGQPPPSVVEVRGADSCALDVADRGPRPTHRVAMQTGTQLRRAQQMVKGALLELLEHGADPDDVATMLAVLEEKR